MPDTPTPTDFFDSHVFLVDEIAPRYFRRFQAHSYERDDITQEALLALWKLALKPRQHVRALSKPYVATVLSRALNRLKKHRVLVPLVGEQYE